MFARRPKIDTTFGVPMDLNQNGLPASGAKKTPSRQVKQSPLVQDGRGWLSCLFGTREQDANRSSEPSPAPPHKAPANAQASWGERGAAYSPRTSSASGNNYASFVTWLESIRRQSDTLNVGAKTLFNIARVLLAAGLFFGFTEGRLGEAFVTLGALAITATAIAERLGLLKDTFLRADKLPGLSGRSIAFTTGSMLGLSIGALAGANILPLPAVGTLVGVCVSALAYGFIGGKLGEWVATKAERRDLLGRPTL